MQSRGISCQIQGHAQKFKMQQGQLWQDPEFITTYRLRSITIATTQINIFEYILVIPINYEHSQGTVTLLGQDCIRLLQIVQLYGC